jgi:hypothetical protein
MNQELESPDFLKQGWKATRAASAAVKNVLRLYW